MRRKRRRRRRIAAFFTTLLIIILIGVIIAGGLLFIKDHQKNKLAGTWEYRIDYSDYIRFSVDDWIGEKDEDTSVITPVSFVLTLNEDGTYSAAVDKGSYEACSLEVQNYVEDRFASVVGNEMILAGYSGEEDVTAVSKSLITETVGDKLGQYLENNGVKFLPEYEEISLLNSSGKYTYDKKEQVIEFADNAGNVKKEKISLSEDVLVLIESADLNIAVNTGADGISVQNNSEVIKREENDTRYPITFRRK